MPRLLCGSNLKNETVAAMLVLVIVLAAGAGYLIGTGNQRTTTLVSTTPVTSTFTATTTATSTKVITTTPITATTTVTSRTTVWLSQTTITATSPPPNTPSGLSLRMTVNGTTIGEGEDVTITATLFNPLLQNNNVSTTSNWPFYGLLMFNKNWPPCGYYSPIELVVLTGNYSSGQIRSMSTGGSPGLMCYEFTSYISFNFSPDSDSVYVTGIWSVSGNASTYGPVNASVTVTTNGYWDNSGSMAYSVAYSGLGNYNQFPAEHPFAEGVYTIAIGDEWGQLVVIHVTVE